MQNAFLSVVSSQDSSSLQELLVLHLQLFEALEADMVLFATPQSSSSTLPQRYHQLVLDVIDTAENLKISGEGTLSFPNYGDFLEEMLNKVITLSISYSKQAIAMVYRLSEVVERLDTLGSLVDDIGTVNRKTKMLALNATIESVHAGNAGATFQHVASEVRDLADSVSILARKMQEEISSVTHGVRETHAMLVECAGMDMQPMVEAGERLERLMLALLEQQEAFRAAREKAAGFAQEKIQVSSALPLPVVQKILRALRQQSQQLHLLLMQPDTTPPPRAAFMNHMRLLIDNPAQFPQLSPLLGV